jgi:diacylglycerol kinase (ATP)
MPELFMNIDSYINQSLPSPLLIKNRVGIMYNPISGYGKGKKNSIEIKKALEEVGISVELRQTEKTYNPDEISSFIKSIDLLLVAGGDGSIGGLLSSLNDNPIPTYLIPSGNESLFARSFGMSKKSVDIMAAIRQATVSEHYYGLCGERPFFIMASLGFDSKIISRIAQTRKSAIGHMGYVVPTIKELLTFKTPKITLEVDGKLCVDDQYGYLIIANRPDYALRMNPTPEAKSIVPELTARFFPNHSVLASLQWLTYALLGGQIPIERGKLYSGKTFRVSVSNLENFPIQIDGEYGGEVPLTIRSSTTKIKVLEGINK